MAILRTAERSESLQHLLIPLSPLWIQLCIVVKKWGFSGGKSSIFHEIHFGLPSLPHQDYNL